MKILYIELLALKNQPEAQYSSPHLAVPTNVKSRPFKLFFFGFDPNRLLGM